MAIAIGCITPHPPIIIPEIGGENIDRVRATVEAMSRLASKVAASEPDAIVVISPHSPGYADAIAIKTAERLRGSFASFGSAGVSFEVENDLELAEAITREAKEMGVPIVSLAERFSILAGREELDHGVMVPLYYIFKELKRPIASLSISYLGREKHYALGTAVRKASDRLGKRIAFVASGDLSHRLLPGAPAGYSPVGKEFDELMVSLVRGADFAGVLDIDAKLADEAGECGLRSIIALVGAFDGYGVKTEVLSYERPFGVGYLVAAVRETGLDPERKLLSRAASGEGRTTLANELNPHTRLARLAVQSYVTSGRVIEPPEITPPDLLENRAACFVCLKHTHGELRGCIGTLAPTQANLALEIISNAIQAATADPRFPPVGESELPYLKYSVDVLDPAEKISGPDQLNPRVYGVIVKRGFQTGVLLPMLEGVDTVERQLEIAKRKAGIALDEDVELYRFRVTRYEE